MRAAVGGLFAPAPPPASDLADQPTQPLRAAATAPAETTPPPPRRTTLAEGDLLDGRYRVVQAYPLDTCTFYDVTRTDGNQGTLLAREVRSQQPIPAENVADLLRLSRNKGTQIVPHLEIVQEKERRYTVLQHPGRGWRSLARTRVPLETVSAALAWTEQVGQVLLALHGAGYGHWPPGPAGREGLIIDRDNRVQIADLTLCRRARQDVAAADCRSLALLLYYLSAGEDLAPEDNAARGAPTQVRAVIRRALNGGYSDVKLMLEALGAAASAPPRRRALRQLSGNATDPGQRHERNEDFVAALTYNLDQRGQTPPLGLYIVADGMGGYAAGDRASQGSAQQAFLHFVRNQMLPSLEGKTQRLDAHDTPGQKLRAMVQQANQLVYESRRASGSERGTTMTAAMVMGDEAIIANVGDSRTYLFHDGALTPITQDHSLVASLVKAGQITPDEVYSHPQRNQIYRSLGDKAQVEVDIYAQHLEQGDRLLLCSDGLWEMVRDPDIARILAHNASAQAACDALIAAANDNGGEDNISAIVVNIE
jgi:protein phosphatase